MDNVSVICIIKDIQLPFNNRNFKSKQFNLNLIQWMEVQLQL